MFEDTRVAPVPPPISQQRPAPAPAPAPQLQQFHFDCQAGRHRVAGWRVIVQTADQVWSARESQS